MRSAFRLAVSLALVTFGCGSTGEVAPSPTAGTPDGGGVVPSGDGGTVPGVDGGAGDGGTCVVAAVPACDAAPPDPGPKRAWTHTTSGAIALATPNHRGRDLFVNPGDAQWVIGKIAYGTIDKDLTDEDVDVWLNRACGATWEKLGTVRTTTSGQHASVEGIDDTGGRVYFPIRSEKALGPGRHRVRLVVAGDLTATELFIEVVPRGTPMIVSDVDGTLTTSENAEFPALLTGTLPDANANSAQVLTSLAKKGYRPMYVTARPEWLVERTREFLAKNNFPAGIVHTTTGGLGATGVAAITYKTGELKMIADRGLVPAWAFGNTDTDAQSYENAKVQPTKQRVFYQFADTQFGGRRIDSYASLIPEIGGLPLVCSP